MDSLMSYRKISIRIGSRRRRAIPSSRQTPRAAESEYSFSYQGRLTDGGTPVTGNYDLQFALWDSAERWQPGWLYADIINSVAVSNGVFTATLDFGANSFPGASRFLEISARHNWRGIIHLADAATAGSTSTPYAVRTSAAFANGRMPPMPRRLRMQHSWGRLQPTSTSRVTTRALPTLDLDCWFRSNYIQTNPSSAENASFNISGNGTAGGNLTGGNLISGSSVGSRHSKVSCVPLHCNSARTSMLLLLSPRMMARLTPAISVSATILVGSCTSVAHAKSPRRPVARSTPERPVRC